MRVQLAGVAKQLRRAGRSRRGHADHRPARADRPRRAERSRQVDVAPDRRGGGAARRGVVDRAPERDHGRVPRAGATKRAGRVRCWRRSHDGPASPLRSASSRTLLRRSPRRRRRTSATRCTRAVPRARRRRLRAAARARCAPSSGSASTSNATAQASRAARLRASRSRRSCSRASNCSCSTSRPTISTSRGSSGSSRFSARTAAHSSSCRTIASCSTGPSTGSRRSSPRSHQVREWAGGWSDYAGARDAERAAAVAEYEQAQARRKELAALLSDAAHGGAREGRVARGQDRRRRIGARRTRSRRRCARPSGSSSETSCPRSRSQPWELRLTLAPACPSLRPRAEPRRVQSRSAARSCSGRSTSTSLPASGCRSPGRTAPASRPCSGCCSARCHCRRRAHGGSAHGDRRDWPGAGRVLRRRAPRRRGRARAGIAPVEARTLLAKFGLGADHIGRACSSLSPGERTRAHLAELQARGVNVLVLDEPTNHLDLEAVEQLESALVDFDGTLVVVSHDRRFLERIAPTQRDRPAAIVPAAHGRSEAKDVEVEARQAPRAARDYRPAPPGLPDTASSQSGRIASARTARRTRAGTSSRCASTRRRYST